MRQRPFHILYWQFLFRIVDLELLSASAQGDSSKLLGQFAALLIYFSLAVAFGGLVSGINAMPPAQKQAATWAAAQFLISTTMLVVGLFSVLSWESIFPDRRDLLVLGPLPVRERTLFLAKASAAAAALVLAVAALHCATCLIWPLLLMRAGSGVLGALRSFAGYWAAMFAAGAFTYASLLCVQGLASLLPRRRFLRVSGILQMTAYAVLIGGYILAPSLVAPAALTSPANQSMLWWVPSYWFWGLFQHLNGTGNPVLNLLAWRALAGLAIAILGAGTAFLLSYLRTIRKIMEEPDIVPGARGGRTLPRFGSAPVTAMVHFNIRTLLRSRQHRLVLAFFLGLAFAILVLCLKGPPARSESAGNAFWRQPNAPLIVSSISMMLLVLIGVRVAFAMPTELNANWIFRTANSVHLMDCLRATRRSLFVLGVAPVCVIWAAALFWLWPLGSAAEHLALLALLGVIVGEAGLYGFHKIPFTCSYLPGKANVYIVFLFVAPFAIPLMIGIETWEKKALRSTALYEMLVAAMAVAAIAAQWATMALARSDGAELRFEEVEPPEINDLKLRRDL